MIQCWAVNELYSQTETGFFFFIIFNSLTDILSLMILLLCHSEAWLELNKCQLIRDAVKKSKAESVSV